MKEMSRKKIEILELQSRPENQRERDKESLRQQNIIFYILYCTGCMYMVYIACAHMTKCTTDRERTNECSQGEKESARAHTHNHTRNTFSNEKKKNDI